MTEDFEKLGLFYLGRRYDLQRRETTKDLVLYESKDLVTHGVCIGMTGSGKTGLCLSLIEEAAIDGIPVIAIDPKGDLSNLLLTFPNLSASEFRPWISDDDARRAGVSSDELSQSEARKWSDGLAAWGQTGARIKRLHETADFRVYTPGSTAGLPVSILNALSAPKSEILEDDDALRELISNTSTCILALVGLSGDPLKSREHILVSNILQHAWRAEQSLTLCDLIQLIQKPAMNQIGVLDLESFFPKKARFEFAMSINALLAAPGFDVWLKGQPLNIGDFLHTETGKPKVSIFSINHLSDSERMFFVSLLLNQIVAWMRTQAGTTSLRAILYMDEIFGYFPPVANPPSKTPLLTLLKQARAYGLGILLASQNPVDLDYKGLSNTGTWFIGRLQTERDKARVLEGLEGAAADSGVSFDRAKMSQTLAGLGNRVFLMNNVHEDAPEVFETRWTMSYLRGPLTKNQIKTLMAPYKSSQGSEPEDKAGQNGPTQPSSSHQSTTQGSSTPESSTKTIDKSTPQSTGQKSSSRPSIPRVESQFFIPVKEPLRPDERLQYSPVVLALCSVRFADARAKLDLTVHKSFAAGLEREDLPLNWSDAVSLNVSMGELRSRAELEERETIFEMPPQAMAEPANYKRWSASLANWLVATQKQYLLYSAGTKQFSQPNETERDFRMRLQSHFTDERDERVRRLRDKYTPKLGSLKQKIAAAQQKQEREQEELRSHDLDSIVSVSATVIGAVMGRKALSQRTMREAGSTARRLEKANRQRQEVQRANENLSELCSQLDVLENEFKEELSLLEWKLTSAAGTFEPVAFAPKKSSISIDLCTLAWLPSGFDGAHKRVLW